MARIGSGQQMVPLGVDVRPLQPTERGQMLLDSAPGYIDAASGIVAHAGTAWVVSDGLPKLVRYDRLGAPGTTVDALPARKKKYDLESIASVARGDGQAGVSLLALGSGSKSDRALGVVQDLTAEGALDGAPRQLDLAPVYGAMARVLPNGLNVEATAVQQSADGARLLLMHRGMSAGDPNTVFALDLARVLGAAASGAPVGADALVGSRRVELGSLRGHPLGFSDAKVLADGSIAFTASAETSDSGGKDGEIVGSVVGLLDANLGVRAIRPLTGAARKVEGIELAAALDPAAPANRFVLVTDADDPAKPSELLTVDL